jgi:hypothetical protein
VTNIEKVSLQNYIPKCCMASHQITTRANTCNICNTCNKSPLSLSEGRWMAVRAFQAGFAPRLHHHSTINTIVTTINTVII